ncbi:MAG TPA: hypothetical protein VG518_08545 [Solirubrobacterales bacterium]|nr:hypothetical protein [Solirubrobacterales bacterium]
MHKTLTPAVEPALLEAGPARCVLCGGECEDGAPGGDRHGPEDLAGALCPDHRHELARLQRSRPGLSRAEALATFLEAHRARRGGSLRRFQGTLGLLRR